MRARLKNDFELEEFDHMSRTANENWGGLSSTPETVPLMGANVYGERVVLTGKRTLPLLERHQKLLERINSHAAFKYITEPKAGWFNTGLWKAESIGFGDNLVEVEHSLDNHAQIKTIDYYQEDLSGLSYATHPWLIHRFTVVTRKGTLIRPGNGVDVYIFLISKVPLWVPAARLDYHRTNLVTPQGFTEVRVIRVPWTKIRQRPVYDSPMNLRATVGTRWRIAYIQNSWGCVPEKGWVDMADVVAV